MAASPSTAAARSCCAIPRCRRRIWRAASAPARRRRGCICERRAAPRHELRGVYRRDAHLHVRLRHADGTRAGPRLAAGQNVRALCDSARLADRFLIATLFGGEWRSVTGFFIDTYVIILAALVSYRLTLAAQMVRQYPWLYRRRFLFAWKKR